MNNGVDTIQLRKGGILFGREWSVDSKDYIDVEITEEELVYFIDCNICVERGVTLKDFFCMVYNYFDAIKPILGCTYLEEIVNEAFEVPETSSQLKIHGLELCWVPNFSEEEEGKYLCDFIDLVPLGADIDLELTPIYYLVGLPLIVNEDFILEDEELIKKHFTFLSFTGAIIENLSYT